MRIRTWLLLVLFVAVGFSTFIVFGVPAVPDSVAVVYAAPAPAMLSRLEADTLSYTDSLGGYSFRYPVGYRLEVEEGQSAVFYSSGISGFSESFVIKPTTETLGPAYMQQLVADELSSATQTSESRVRVDGRAAWRLEYAVLGENLEGLVLVQAAVPCGAMTLYYVATIPDSLREDIELADYVLYSLSCPTAA